MLNKNNKSLTVGLIALLIIGALAFFLLKGAPKPAEHTPVSTTVAEQSAPQQPAQTQTTAEEPKPVEEPKEIKPENTQSMLAAPAAMTVDVAAAMKDRVLGNDNAPVTIIEYASMTCPHCAHFAKEILPEVKKRLIDTGKARLIFRDFPMDNFGLKAAMMTRCIPSSNYFSLVEVVFSNQERWTQSKDPLESLSQLGALAGMDADFFKACTQNPELETAILNGVQDAQSKYQIKATPTFIFNNGAEIMSGAQDAVKFEEIVNKLTKGK